METVCRTRIPILLTAAVLTGWTSLCVHLCNRVLPGMPPPFSTTLLSACNLSALAAMLGLLGCVIQLFRKRPLLRISKRGIWFRLSRKKKGTLPWRHISRISLDPDGVTLRLHLHKPADPEDQMPLQAEPGGGWSLTLPLRWKVRNPEQVCRLLQQRQQEFSSYPVDSVLLPETDEQEQRRFAAAKRRGLYVCLIVMSFLLSKLWLLWLGLYAFSSNIAVERLHLSLLAGLGICLPPFLLSYLWLRRQIKCVLAAMNAAVHEWERQESGL